MRRVLALSLAFGGLVAPFAVVPFAHAGTGDVQSVDSTAYCDKGVMYSGEWVYDGAVAVRENGPPIGTNLQVLGGPYAGRVLTVEDHIQWGSDFDIWMADCNAAVNYGHQLIQIQQV
jgi:3D (Asp-Asp-Asp) domain-containing protein